MGKRNDTPHSTSVSTGDPSASTRESGITISETNIEELTAWRQAISGEAAARAARRADADAHARLRELADRTHELLSDADAYRTADAAFHLAIAELSGSRRLLEAEQGIQDELTRIISTHPGGTEARSTPGELHDPLTRAIVAGDAGRAREEFRIHAQATADMCLIFTSEGGRPEGH
ncbi:FadR/GntR family transcriptional regulator [Streptomyces endophyticus]|uniref:FCD domain-containing protein n=1 Tax=Streptomyces endophyticus TaxID=714166 RepID=A0ABU6F765_9ACTN|nr:FCD domain-containing protein [Streptomyces endophyticus]MEB8339863.1 FCD domain-containing protein [Streptomyces endophyticus]